MDQTSHMIRPRGPARRVPRPPLNLPSSVPENIWASGEHHERSLRCVNRYVFQEILLTLPLPRPRAPGGRAQPFGTQSASTRGQDGKAGRSCRHQPACPRLCREPSAQGSGWEAGGTDPGPGQGGRAASPTHAVRKARDALAAPAGLTAVPGPHCPPVQARRTQVLKVVDGEPRLHRETTGSQDCHLGWGEGLSD